MSRIKTKELKNQYMVRVYDQNEYDLLKRALEKFKDKFESLNDAIKYFALLGADKMLGDNTLNQSINFSEIRKYMQSIDEKLGELQGDQRMNFVDTNAEVKTNQSLLNLITKMLNKLNQINLHSYTEEWKYSPLDEYGLEEQKEKHLGELLNVTKRSDT